MAVWFFISRRFVSEKGDVMDAQFTAEDFPGGLRACMEAILMVADQPQHAADLARVLGVGEQEARAALERLRSQYDEEGRGFELRHTARGWQFASRAQYEQVVSAFVTDGQTARLSQAALEALAIVAYKQPVTRAQVAAIRGVNSDGVIRSLTVRGLVREDGVVEFIALSNTNPILNAFPSFINSVSSYLFSSYNEYVPIWLSFLGFFPNRNGTFQFSFPVYNTIAVTSAIIPFLYSILIISNAYSAILNGIYGSILV